MSQHVYNQSNDTHIKLCENFDPKPDIINEDVTELYDAYIGNKKIFASIIFGPFLTNDMNIYTDPNYDKYKEKVETIMNEIVNTIDESSVKGKLIIKHDYKEDKKNKKNNIKLTIQICSIRDFFKVETLFRLYSSKYITYALEVDSDVSSVNLFSINESSEPTGNNKSLRDQYESIMSANKDRIFAQRRALLIPPNLTKGSPYMPVRKPHSDSRVTDYTNR